MNFFPFPATSSLRTLKRVADCEMLRNTRPFVHRRAFCHASRVQRAQVRSKQSSASAAKPGPSSEPGPSTAKKLMPLALITVGAVGLAYVSARKRPVQNDTAIRDLSGAEAKGNKNSKAPGLALDDEHLLPIAWGSNKTTLISPNTPEVEYLQSPSTVTWLKDIALRDLALHEKHGACVDAKGDVYQWGTAYLGEGNVSNEPVLSLKGKDVISVQVSPSRVFALSSSGKIYTLASEYEKQSVTVPANSSSWSPSSWIFGESQTTGFEELSTDQKLGRNEKFVSISAGNDHLLAVTSEGRAFAHPISKNANAYGQLGFRKLTLPSQTSSSTGPGSRVEVELVPKAIADPFSRMSPNQRTRRDLLPSSAIVPPSAPAAIIIPGDAATESPASIPELEDNSIRFCDRLFEIPSLRGVKVVQAVAGARSSFVRTEGDRVLAWGANEYGQLGLGSTMTIDTITVPTEVVFTKGTSSRARSHCVDIRTGGDLTFFIVERNDGSFIRTTDVLSCGMGQWGGLGTGLYSTAQGSPTRVKAISGLLEFSEKTENLQPVVPYGLSVSPTGHVLLTLDTLARAGPGLDHTSGRDLLVWGANRDYQLGNGKRASLATPTTLELPGLPHSVQLEGDDESKGRLMLMRRRAKEVKDMQGRSWKRNVEVEQCAVAGWGSSLVYWKICEP